jgi:hypothetical protein
MDPSLRGSVQQGKLLSIQGAAALARQAYIRRIAAADRL